MDDDVVIDGCTAGSLNCCYDHWGGSTNCIRAINSSPTRRYLSVVNFSGIEQASVLAQAGMDFRTASRSQTATSVNATQA